MASDPTVYRCGAVVHTAERCSPTEVPCMRVMPCPDHAQTEPDQEAPTDG